MFSFWGGQQPPRKVARTGSKAKPTASTPSKIEPIESKINGPSGPVKCPISEFNTEPVALDVRGRHFFTTVGTLCSRNGFFHLLLSGRWTIPKTLAGAIFVDSDPDVFTHILAFLRHGVFPVVFQPKSGHDHKLYLDILSQATYFCIPELEAWLQHKCYYKATRLVTTQHVVGPEDRKTYDIEDLDIIEFLPTLVETKKLDEKDRLRFRQDYQTTPNEYSFDFKHGTLERISYIEVRRKVCFMRGWLTADGKEWQDYWARECKYISQDFNVIGLDFPAIDIAPDMDERRADDLW